MAENLSRLPLAIGFMGPGLIGKTLLRQLMAQTPALLGDFKLDLRVVSIANSRNMFLSDEHVNLADWETDFQAKAVPLDLDLFVKHLAGSPAPHRVVVDCSSSEVVAKNYIRFMESGFHIVTPNKKMGSGPLQDYLALRELSRQKRLHWMTEATCGAGLPVLSTLKHLVQTGDQILRIEGILSGTLSYIFNNLCPGIPFSQVVKTAKDKGFTEPDPRDDLSGMDVARKIVLLAREAGCNVELEDVSVLNLVPEQLQQTESADEFMAGLPNYDSEMERKVAEAAENGEVLRYVAVMDGTTSKCRVELRNYLNSHAFAQLQGSDNIIMFTTSRYRDQPLIIRGPGAGAEVTAAGVFSDILKVAECLGKPT